MAEDHKPTAEVDEHRRGHLAREGAAGFVVHVLGPDRHARGAHALRKPEGHANGAQVGGGGTKNEFDIANFGTAAGYGLGEFGCLGLVKVHLPVAGNDLPA